jgi:hypothetical protein
MKKLNLQYGELVRVVGTGCELDGCLVRVVGVSVRHIQDIYILEFDKGHARPMPDGSMWYRAFTMPECCIERVKE